MELIVKACPADQPDVEADRPDAVRGYYTEPIDQGKSYENERSPTRAEREAAFTAMHCIPTRRGADRPDRLRRVPTIPGVSGAEGLVGPPLDRMG